MPIARDESLKPPQWPDAGRNRAGYKPPQVLFDNTFDSGFEGYAQHGNSDHSLPQLSLTDMRTWPGSKYGLMMSLSERPYQTWNNTIRSGSSTAMLRSSAMHPQTGLLAYEVWYTIGGFNTDVTPRQYGFQFDIENWPSSIRAVPTLRCQRVTGSVAGGTIVREDQWTVTNDAGSHVEVHRGNVLGPNENKMGWERMTLWFNFNKFPAGGTDGSQWGYEAIEIGNTYIPLNVPGAPQVGRGKRLPQADTGVSMYEFWGGENFGVFMQNNTTEVEPGPSWMIVGRARASWYEPAGEVA